MEMDYSLVIPIKDEKENLSPLLEEIESAFSSLTCQWELLAINDGSTDGSGPLLDALAQSRPYLKVLHFDRNYGQSSAFHAGFQEARGQWVITLDADRQNHPQDILKLLPFQDQADLICGRREKRQDQLMKRLISKWANWIRSRVCSDGVSDTGCSLKAYRKKALDQIPFFDGMHRFLPALFVLEGWRIKEVPVSHRPRLAGKTKYGFFNRNINTLLDLFAVWWMRKRKLRYRIQNRSP